MNEDQASTGTKMKALLISIILRESFEMTLARFAAQADESWDLLANSITTHLFQAIPAPKIPAGNGGTSSDSPLAIAARKPVSRPGDELLDTKRAGEMLGFRPTSVARLGREGVVPCTIKRGFGSGRSAYFFKEGDLRAFMRTKQYKKGRNVSIARRALISS